VRSTLCSTIAPVSVRMIAHIQATEIKQNQIKAFQPHFISISHEFDNDRQLNLMFNDGPFHRDVSFSSLAGDHPIR
jgi:hypothetical protein